MMENILLIRLVFLSEGALNFKKDDEFVPLLNDLFVHLLYHLIYCLTRTSVQRFNLKAKGFM